MKKLTTGKMTEVQAGSIELIQSSGDFSYYSSLRSVNSAALVPLHYSVLDCVGFGGSLLGLGLAVVGTGGAAMFGGLLALGTLAASAGDCEGYLNGK